MIYDSIQGEQISVHLYRIENPGVGIPGLPADVEVGDWFVSPELARRIELEPSLERRYFGAGDIGEEGVGSADELVAVRLAGPEAPLDFRFVAEPATEHSGLDAGVTAGHVLAGAAVVVVAGIGLLRAAVGPVSVGLERRLTLLSLLGATRLRLWQLQAASTAVVAVPAAAGAAAAWHLTAPGLSAVPVVGQRVLSGDLAMPIGATAAVAAAVVVLVTLIGLRQPYRRAGSRPIYRVPSRPGAWRLLPLAASLGLVGYSTTFSGTSRAPTLFITGLLAASLTVTVALPVLIDRLGARLSRGRSVLALLVGRSLNSNARVSARSLTALASVAVLVPAAASYISVARARDPVPASSAVQTLTVHGELAAEVRDELEWEAGGVFAEVYRSGGTGPDRERPTFTWVADCGSLERHMALLECSGDSIVAEPAAAAAFARFDAAAAQPPVDATLTSLLFITEDGNRAEDVLRYHLVNNDRIDMSVTSLADEKLKEARSVAWILAAIAIGSAGAVAALLLSVVTGASLSAGTRLRLVGVGADLAMIRRLAASESAVTIGIVGLAGTAVGTLGAVAYTVVDGSTPLLYRPSLVIGAAVLAAAAASALASSLSVSNTALQAVINVRD